MKKAKKPAADAAAISARLAEFDRVTAEIRSVLDEMVALLRARVDIKPADLVRRIGDLKSAQLKVMELEDAIHAKGDARPDEGPDYDAIRAEIGRRLDRIRAARDAKGVSGGAG